MMRNYASNIFLLIVSVLVLSSLSPSENPIYDKAVLDSPVVYNISSTSGKTTPIEDSNSIPLRRDIHVMGIIIDDDNGIFNSATFSIDGEQKFVRVGDLVVDGILLDEVKDNFAYVSYFYDKEKMQLSARKIDAADQVVESWWNANIGGFFDSSDSVLGVIPHRLHLGLLDKPTPAV